MKTYKENYNLLMDAVNFKNKKPLTCFTAQVVGAHLNGMTIAECIADPVKNANESIKFLKQLDEECGGVTCLNAVADGLNPTIGTTRAWSSQVLKPGVELDENSVWQVVEKKKIESNQYDEILEMGFNNFIEEKILPNIIDFDYMNKYLKIFAESHEAIFAQYKELGYPITMDGRCPAVVGIPFESLSGLRSMTEFYYDCYTQFDKVKETCDFIFKELYTQAEAGLENIKDNQDIIGNWIGGWRTASAMVSPKIWENLVWPYMKKAAEQLIRFNKLPIMHLDQNWDRDIERFSELGDGNYVLNTDGMTDLRNARKKLPKACFMGDVPPTLLTAGTPEQVSEYVTKLIDDIGPTGLIVTAGCDTPVTAKRENIVAMLKAANDWH